jgi:hypothetical protein
MRRSSSIHRRKTGAAPGGTKRRRRTAAGGFRVSRHLRPRPTGSADRAPTQPAGWLWPPGDIPLRAPAAHGHSEPILGPSSALRFFGITCPGHAAAKALQGTRGPRRLIPAPRGSFDGRPGQAPKCRPGNQVPAQRLFAALSHGVSPGLLTSPILAATSCHAFVWHRITATWRWRERCWARSSDR